MINSNVKTFFRQNWWLEEGVSYLLRRLNFQVKTGVYVLGASCVEHEMDVLGNKKEGYRGLACECKSTDIDSSDIFTLAGKMREIGYNEGILFTISEKVDEDMKKLAKAFSIKIIDSVLKKEEKEIIEGINRF